ncbi:hypothetical protein NS2_00960 [Nocardia seriolae NBRC 15557]|nr:hypothetical protein NS2_00960 [Nocardia seriolae NBRC 15557]
MVRLRADRAEQVHQPLERHVGVREGGQVGAADLGQQVAEGRARRDLAAQHQSIDEHADQVVQRALAAARDRGADGDVGGAGQARGPGRQGGVDQHEQRDVVLAGDAGECAVQLGVDREVVDATGIGGDLGPRPVGGQFDLLGQVGQPVGPVGDLLGGDGLGIGFRAEDLALPQRVVGVLHRQRRPGRGVTVGAGQIGGHHIPQQRAQRRAVGADVVQHQHDHVLGLGEAEHCGAERQLAGDVEVDARELRDARGEFGRGDGLGPHLEVDLGHRQDALVAVALDLGVDGAQRLVPGQHVADGRVEGGEIDGAGELQRHRDVVDRGAVVEAVEEPHALLRQRQRHQLRPFLRHQRGARAGADARLQVRGKRSHGGGLEQGAQRDVGVEGGGQARDHLGGDQRVAAEFEEVVVQAHPVQAEHVGDGAGDGLLHRGGRGAEAAGGEGRRGQLLAVQLAGGIEREGVQHHEGGRDHVGGELLGQRVAHGVDIHGRVGRDQVGDQLITGALVMADDHDRLGDGIDGGQRRLDLAQLDAQTAQLDLEVGAAQVLQLAIAGPGDEVTGAVHAHALAERVGHEAIRGQVGAGHVPGGELIARQIELTRDTHRNRLQPRIQHVDLGVEDRGTDRHRRDIGIDDLVIGHVDRGLGGAVQVVQARTGQLAQLLRGRRGQSLTGGEDIGQADAFGRGRCIRCLARQGGHEDRQHRRHEVGDRDALADDDPGQVGRIAVAVRLGDHQARADLQGPEELPHRHVEGRRGLLEHHVVGGQPVLGVHPDQAVDDRGVRDGDTLGAAGRAGREDHVGGIARAQRREPLGIGDRGVGEAGQIQLVDPNLVRIDAFHAHTAQRAVIAGSQHADRLRGVEDVLGPLGRVIRIQRHVRATGHGHGVHARDQVDGAAHAQRHKRFRADALGDEPASQLAHPSRELGVGQTRPLERDRGRVRSQRHLRLEQRNQCRRSAFGDLGQRRVQLERGVVPALEQPAAFTVAEQLDLADQLGRVGGHGGEHGQEALREDIGVLRVEKVRRVDEFGVHGGVAVNDLAQRELEVELGGLLIHGQLGHAQPRQLQRGAPQVLERQHHLEQRVPRLRPRRVEHLDQPLERHVRMRERLKVALAHGLQQLGDARAGVHRRTQHQRVDEHADEIVQGLLATTRHRNADGDVIGAAQAGQQRGESAVHHHEQGGAIGLRHPVQPGDELTRHLEAMRARVIGGDGRARLDRQAQLVRQPGQRRPPVVQLLGDERTRILFRAQRFPLPQRVIRVLHRQFGPARGLSEAARHVGGHEVAHQRVHGETVGGDVVGHQHQHVVVRREAVGAQPDRGIGGDIEALGREGVDRGVQLALGHVHDLELGHGAAGRQHLLVSDALVRRVDRAQRFVAGDHIGDRAAHGVEIQCAGEPYGRRDVVGGRLRIEPVEEPHALLRER